MCENIDKLKDIIEKNKKEMDELISNKLKIYNENNKIEFNNIINKNIDKKPIKEKKI